jgi:hypothetical protein
MANTATTVCIQDPCQDELVQRLLCNPNLQVINQPYSSAVPIVTQRFDSLPIISSRLPTVSSNS